MKKRSLFKILPIFLLMVSCGGPAKTIVSASISVPFDLLVVESYDAQLTLSDPVEGTVLQGPIVLEKDETTNLWNILLEDIDEQDFLAEVEIIVPGTDGNLVIASATREILVPKGAPYATLTFKPSDFDTGMDDNADGVTNLDEITGGVP